MRTWSAESDGSARAAGALMARPDEWPERAPHFRSAWGLGAPGPLEPALALVLGPVFTRSLRRLAGIAAR